MYKVKMNQQPEYSCKSQGFLSLLEFDSELCVKLRLGKLALYKAPQKTKGSLSSLPDRVLASTFFMSIPNVPVVLARFRDSHVFAAALFVTSYR